MDFGERAASNAAALVGPRLVTVSRGDGPVQPLPTAEGTELPAISLACSDGTIRTLADVVRRTHTDALLVVRESEVVAHYERVPASLHSPHLVMSVSKSVVGCVAARLLDDGTLTESTRVVEVVPELAGGYREATVRHLLDMRTAVDYDEHQDLSARGRVLAQVMYEPPQAWTCTDSIYDYLRRLGEVGKPGGPFCYRSTDTDALGWVIERATGSSMIDLISQLIIAPLGLEQDGAMVVDAYGTPAHSGGLLLCARDLTRFALMLLNAGTAGGRQVVPVRFLRDVRRGDSDSVAAMRQAAVNRGHADLAAGSRAIYRSQFWVPEQGGTRLLCLGIHGQLVVVDYDARMVAVKLSWWPTPQDPGLFHDSVATVDALITATRHSPGAVLPLVR
ncbi:MAG: serine hydrolase [Tetrasphaera sp.]